MLHTQYYTNIFRSPAEALVNPVNCVGVMGAGLALAFKQRYPAMYAAYRKHCQAGKLQPGSVFLYKADKWIINVPTKIHWENPSELTFIHQGIAATLQCCANNNIQSVAWTLLGTSNGQLDKDTVHALMASLLSPDPRQHILYL